jgi:Type II secretion system (T2SS), protein M subtype b
MKMGLRMDRTTIVVGGSVGLLLILVLYWLLQFWFMRQEFAEEIAMIEPKTSRLLGIMQSAEALAAASDTAQGRLRELTYPSDLDAAATAAAMQQNIRELMMGAGMSISGSQILPQLQSSDFDRLRLDITAEGNIEALDGALASLESLRPLVFVDSLKVTPIRSRNQNRGRLQGVEEDSGSEDPRRLTARLQLFSLRLKD